MMNNYIYSCIVWLLLLITQWSNEQNLQSILQELSHMQVKIIDSYKNC